MDGANLAAVAAEAAEGASKPQATDETTKPPAAATSPEKASPSIAPAPDLAAVRREAAQAERERLLALDVMALPGCEPIIEDAKKDGSMPAETALAMVRHIKAAGLLDISKQMAAAADTVPPLADAPHDPVGGQQAAKPKPGSEEAWRADYEASADLQTEFASADTYVAYRKAAAGGRTRILGRKEG